LSIEPRPEIKDLDICHHGGLIQAELDEIGLAPDDVIDFSVSANPYSCPPGVRDIFCSVAIDRYPDSESTDLKEAIARKHGVAVKNILAGSGATEIIRLVALAYFGRGDTVLCPKPTFGEYEVACRISGADIMEQWGSEENCFAPGLDKMLSWLERNGPKGVFICNPVNPSGQYLGRREVEGILEASPRSLVVLDESYNAFTEGVWASEELLSRNNVVIIRSMTKDYALAGLRLGYALADEGVIADLHRVCPPWNVNAVAQRAGIVALEDGEHLRKCEKRIREAKKLLMEGFDRLGYTVLPSSTNFFLLRVGDAGRFRLHLLKKGIIVRDCTSFGLPRYVRIAALKMPQCQKLLDVVEKSLDEGLLVPPE